MSYKERYYLLIAKKQIEQGLPMHVGCALESKKNKLNEINKKLCQI